MNESRERKLEDLKDALEENTNSKALFAAAEYAIRMAGGRTAVPTGQIDELMQRAEEQGSVTPQEIAEVLDTNTISVGYESHWYVQTE